MQKKHLGSLLISIAITLLSSYSVHATMFNYVGAGTITTADTELNIIMQIEIDSYLYAWWDLETPVLSDPDVALTEIHKMPMENGTVYIEGYGLFENVTGSLGGVLALEDLNDPSTDYLAVMNQGFSFDSPDGNLFAGRDHLTTFYNYDGTPYNSEATQDFESDIYIREPWMQEYGMCAPIMIGACQ